MMDGPGLRWWKKGLLLLAGLGLAVAAAHQAWRPETGQAIAANLRTSAGGMMIAGILFLSLANWGLTSLLFWLVHREFQADPPIGFRTMLGLIQASALMNHLPLGWAGPMARSAYLKWRHAVPVRQSLLALGVVLGVSLLVSLLVVGCLGWAKGSPQAVAGLFLTGILIGVLAMPALAAARRWWRWPLHTSLAGAVPIKLLDVAVSALRLKLALAMLGQPVDFPSALLLAAPEMLVSMLSPTPNGLGVSEWTVAAVAHGLSLAASPLAACAKLLDRALGLLLLLPLGLASARRLMAGSPEK